MPQINTHAHQYTMRALWNFETLGCPDGDAVSAAALPPDPQDSKLNLDRLFLFLVSAINDGAYFGTSDNTATYHVHSGSVCHDLRRVGASVSYGVIYAIYFYFLWWCFLSFFLPNLLVWRSKIKRKLRD